MSTRTETILRRHRYRPLIDLLAPCLLLATMGLTAVGVASAGTVDRATTTESAPPPARAECVELAGALKSPT